MKFIEQLPQCIKIWPNFITNLMVWSLSEHVSFISLCQMNIHTVHMYEWACVCVCIQASNYGFFFSYSMYRKPCGKCVWKITTSVAQTYIIVENFRSPMPVGNELPSVQEYQTPYLVCSIFLYWSAIRSSGMEVRKFSIRLKKKNPCPLCLFSWVLRSVLFLLIKTKFNWVTLKI